MSYYILPKINNTLKFKLKIIDSSSALMPFISYSLLIYYNQLRTQLKTIMENDIDCSNLVVDDIMKVVNPYEYIFTKVPGAKYSISKLKSSSPIMYDVLEILNNINILDNFKQNINCVIFSKNNKDISETISFSRDDTKYQDTYDNYDYLDMKIFTNINERPYHLIFFDSSNITFNNYLCSLIEIILFIIRYQKNGGNSMIKIYSIFEKPIIDAIYILSSLYDKTYIVKPNTNNITTFEKYLVCKDFNVNENKIETLKNYYENLTNILYLCKNNSNKKIFSLFKYEIPCYFVNKLDDINIIIGQQQLESINLLINILKNKSREEKIEIIRKANIQKCILWCEKFHIPHNKLYDKINIFLPANNKNDIESDI